MNRNNKASLPLSFSPPPHTDTHSLAISPPKFSIPQTDPLLWDNHYKPYTPRFSLYHPRLRELNLPLAGAAQTEAWSETEGKLLTPTEADNPGQASTPSPPHPALPHPQDLPCTQQAAHRASWPRHKRHNTASLPATWVCLLPTGLWPRPKCRVTGAREGGDK